MTVCITKEEVMREEAARRFIEKMKKPAFVATVLADAGVDQSLCFCCLHRAQKTCAHVVGDAECKDYVLYSNSPRKVETRLHHRIEECLKVPQWWQQKKQQKIAA